MSLETLVLVTYSRENSFAVQHIVQSVPRGKKKTCMKKRSLLITNRVITMIFFFFLIF